MKKKQLKTNQNHPQIKSYKRAMEKGLNSQHVLPRDDGWIVKRAGSERATKIFTTQRDAKKFASSIAKKGKFSLFIHRKDGRILDRIDYAS